MVGSDPAEGLPECPELPQFPLTVSIGTNFAFVIYVLMSDALSEALPLTLSQAQ